MKIVRMSKSSWFKMIYQNVVIHFDPGFAGFFENQGIPDSELTPDANFILISHHHKDHLQIDMINRIKSEKTIVVGPSACEQTLNRPIFLVKPESTYHFSELCLFVTQAYNTEIGHSIRKVHHRGDFVGYLVGIGGLRIYFAGDTDFIPEMAALGSIDIAFIPIGGTYVMDVEEAVEATKIIKPRFVIPMHQASNSLESFKNKVGAICSSKVVILDVGNSAEIK